MGTHTHKTNEGVQKPRPQIEAFLQGTRGTRENNGIIESKHIETDEEKKETKKAH